MSSLLRSTKFIRFFVGAARSIIATPRITPGAGQLHYVQPQASLFLRSLTTQTATATNQYSSNLEKSLHQLDQDVRRTGRISRKELEDVLEELKHSKQATSSQSLMVIRCCGSLVPEELPEVRTKLVKEIWATLEKLKIPMDISHYNALLRVYLENEHDFSPAEFLQELDKKGVEPNRVTYQRLITRYCQQGDIDGATRVLEFMKEKGVPVNESVFNALIMGHSQAGDMESATGILSVMKQAGLEPSADTYTTLLVGYAKRGEIEKVRDLLKECDQKDIYLLDKDHLDIVFALATHGHHEAVDEVLSRVRKSAGFNQDAISLILRLINNGQEQTALKVLRLMARSQREENEGFQGNQGYFFIRQLVKANRPVESILPILKTLESEGVNSRALFVAAEESLAQGNLVIATALLKELQKAGAPLRQHYFWPLFCSAGKEKNDEKIASTIKLMASEFNTNPSAETVRDYIIPNLSIRDSDKVVSFLKSVGISPGSCAAGLLHELLNRNAIAEAADVASKYRSYYPPNVLKRPLNHAYLKTQATDHYLTILHHIYEGNERREQDDAEGTSETSKDVVGEILVDLITTARDRPIDLKPILQGLLKKGLGISSASAEQIQSRISGEELTNELSELLAKLTSSELETTPAERKKVPPSALGHDEEPLLNKIAQLEKSGQSSVNLKRIVIPILSKNGKIDKALEIYQSLGEEAGPGLQVLIIDGLVSAGRLDEAFDHYKKFLASNPEAGLDPVKALRLVECCFKQDRIAEGLKILEENRVVNKADELPFLLKSVAFQVLNILAEKGDAENLNKTFNLLKDKNYIEVTNVLLGPLVKIHIVKGDTEAAMSKLEELVEKYKMTPWKGELIKRLIETEDAVRLQRLTDISSKVHGEVNSLYDLVFGFVECGKIRQARKILETPGLRTRQDRLTHICERYQTEGSVSSLEGLAEATKDMAHIDRSNIFNQLLTSHIKNNDVDKALGVWTQMQEEDVNVSDDFLLKLANFLETNGKPIPFVKPKTAKSGKKQVDKPPVGKEPKEPKDKRSVIQNSFRNALREKNWASAKAIKKELDSKSTPISNSDLSLYLEGLCQSNDLNEAHNLVLSMLKEGRNISPKVFKFYTIKLAAAGDWEKLNDLEPLISLENKRVVSYDNRLCAAYLTAGRGADYMNTLLETAESATPENIKDLEEKFPRGSVVGIIQSSPELLPKFERIVDLYAQLGAKGPAFSLWMALFLTPELEEKARQVWNTYHLGNEPRPLFQKILKQARATQDLGLLDRLLQQLKESKVQEAALGLLHSTALDICLAKNDVEQALERMRPVLGDVSLEFIHTSTLQRLKTAAENLGKPFPYTIPEKRNKFPDHLQPYRGDFGPVEPTEPMTEDQKFFTQFVGFASSCLKTPTFGSEWRQFLKDDTGILSSVPYNRQNILNIVSIEDEPEPVQNKKSKGKSSSSSSDDEANEKKTESK